MWQDIKLLNTLTGILLGLCVIAVLATGLLWLAQRPLFVLKAVVLQGADGGALRHVNALTARSTALPHIKGNFFTTDLDAVRAGFESVPWVRKAAVRREWPNKLIVSVEEHQPLGTWGDDGRLLSVKGEVFTANLAEAEAARKLLAFDGPPGSEKEVLTRFAEWHRVFDAIGIQPVSLSLSARFAWTIKLDNGVTVKLGRERDKASLKDRLVRLTQIYPQLRARFGDQIERVDLRYPNGLALSAGKMPSGVAVQ